MKFPTSPDDAILENAMYMSHRALALHYTMIVNYKHVLVRTVDVFFQMRAAKLLGCPMENLDNT